ncbi:phage tail tube protein [Azotobacter chroococcum]|uniref:Phage tail protein n=1 Tax=Azotobacter chroococcum TaxID=353 RepID=A0AAQ0C1M1_9GAMM|nr:phage tail tube protein [Azotobacter chroococcum]QQE90491.1 phage tail protein [Azotobacter chroococcum]
MAKLAQGTQIYFLDPDTNQTVAVQCATTFTPGGAPADQIETTCLEDHDRTYEPGLRTPGQATMTINADPENASHLRLHELSLENPQRVLSWAVGWSDGTAQPTVDSSGDFELPTTRTWFTFQGYVGDFPFDFAANTVVTSQVSVQRSGGSAWIKKVTT